MRIPTTVAVLLPLGLATAQGSGGPFLGVGAAITVIDGTPAAAGPMTDGAIYRKNPGFTPYSLIPPPGGNNPRFTAQRLYPDGAAGPPSFRVNAMSAGLDVIFADPVTGRFQFVPGQWTGLVYSVDRQTPGETGTVVHEEAGAADGAAADLFSILVPNSDIPAAVAACYPVGVPQRALNSAEMGLFHTGPAGTASGEIDSLDLFIPLYETGQPIRGLLPNDPTVFFSVDYAAIFDPPGGTIDPALASWFGTETPSSATILRTTWSPAAGQWSTPTVHMTFADLGLFDDDDIDALAVDRERELVVLSLDDRRFERYGQEYDLLLATWGETDFASEAIPLKDENGDILADATGQDVTGNIDAICIEDPLRGDRGSSPFDSFCFGQPLTAVPGLPKTVAGNVLRGTAASAGGLVFTAASLPQPLPGGDVIALVAGQGGPGGTLTSSPQVLMLAVRTSGTTYQFTFGPGWLATIQGQQLDAIWVTIRGGAIEVSSFVRINV